ncbi:probable LRR receptor-like serine/threonine-protein kinase At3g47570 [Rhododendron vialii]|uniref:probable LRR receptor-like serine/threonine-protein kinase At3g47570 n=1 Tax=Rhododendron vialii TaxID=182163 RepID=UPI00265E145A|nr:probable LRR receptor-like serine/threonine-protein kinase At3g47570 [Rhododendron vialii]
MEKLIPTSFILACIALFINPTTLKPSSVEAALSIGNETDRLALLAFKDRITQDPLNLITPWNNSIHYCKWKGVSCSTRHPGRVTVLNLAAKKLMGSLPPQLGNLSFLRGINLENNSFQGMIPQELGRLSRLKHLNLNANEFQGQIPTNLSYCSDIQIIGLKQNNLVGKIPEELSSLSTKKLKGFYVASNELTGSIPHWLGNASSLVQLSMSVNYFQGTIPSELGRLLNLKLFQIGLNNLVGEVPPSIYNISSLLLLGLSFNRFYGKFPQDIGFTLPNLLGLYVGGNQFTGHLPVSISNASGLQDFFVAENNFTGTMLTNLGSLKDLVGFTVARNQLETDEAEGFSFLTSLTNCSNLQGLDIGMNRFKGELPTSIANFSSSLQLLIVQFTQISGSIPEGITNLIGLTQLVISANLITGEIPEGIGKLERLEDLRLFDNRISGSIPETIGNITKLRQIYLFGNNLSGHIPPSLGDCKQLELLFLSGNNLTGFIPKEVVSLSSINLAFYLARNSLTGPLPMEVGNMSNLVKLDVSNNRLSGEIPSTISKCIMLESLRLGDNLFGGRIPLSLSALRSLNYLDLSINKLSGQIPAYLQNFTLLQSLNLSYNDLEGEVPHEGVFRNVSAFSIVENRKLCGGIEILGLPTCEVQVKPKRGTPIAIKIAIPVALLCSVLLVFLLGCLCWKKRSESSPSTMFPVNERFRQVSYAEIVQATNQFSSSNLIGEGRYGSVYKGVLGNEGTVVAVKVFKLTERGAAKSFMAECNTLRSIRHRNLIKIITTCSSIDFKGVDFKALIFEFMPNGNLEEWLHQCEGDQNEHPRSLSLTHRLSIAIDVASALEYLHHHCGAVIVHGDLKPSNILIDSDMTARVGDFGLARFLSDSLLTISQPQTSSIGIRGTVGYVAPEYGMGSKSSIQGDVYSFGILVLEMFTGRRPTDMIFEDGWNLHQFTKAALPQRVMEIADPSLLSELPSVDENIMTGNEKIKECLVAVLTIGASCSMESPMERMDMRDVVAELSRIRTKTFPH